MEPRNREHGHADEKSIVKGIGEACPDSDCSSAAGCDASGRLLPQRRLLIDRISARNRAVKTDCDSLRRKLKDIDIARISARFFSSPDRMSAKAALVAKEFPGATETVGEVCKDIADHRFTLLGYGPAGLGFPIKWSCDYRSSREWPVDVDYLGMGRKAFDLIIDRNGGSEVKFPWDLSNMMWIPILAAGHYLTGNRKCADTFADLVSDWHDKNPLPLGVNWLCPMNIAIRAVNIIVGLTALHPVLPAEFTQKTLALLFQHGVAIMSFPEIERNDKRNNHYLTNLLGLYFLGIMFKDTEEGADWLEFSTAELEMESDYQFYDDGVNFEDSTSYHRLSSEIMLLCAIAAKDNGRPFSKNLLLRLHKGLQFTRDLTRQNGKIPMFGDNDNGRIIQFYGYSILPSADHRHILAAGGEFFDDDSLRLAGEDATPEAVWLTGKFKRAVTADEAGKAKTIPYPDSGYYMIRERGMHIAIRNARINRLSVGGHAHCDQLSFTLFAKGHDVFVDPGTYLYSSSFSERNSFRSVEYHNTIQLESGPMHEYDRDSFEGLWWMRDRADAETEEFATVSGKTVFRGKIRCYENSCDYTVRRALEYCNGVLEITDSAVPVSETKGVSCKAYSRFLLAPEVTPVPSGGGKIRLCAGEKDICSFEVLSENCVISVKDLWVAESYGRKTPSKQIVVEWDPADCPCKIRITGITG